MQMQREQLNVRVRSDAMALMRALRDALEAEAGGIVVSQGDTVEVALRALAKERGVSGHRRTNGASK